MVTGMLPNPFKRQLNGLGTLVLTGRYELHEEVE
jgi:hypothetical protein